MPIGLHVLIRTERLYVQFHEMHGYFPDTIQMSLVSYNHLTDDCRNATGTNANCRITVHGMELWCAPMPTGAVMVYHASYSDVLGCGPIVSLRQDWNLDAA